MGEHDASLEAALATLASPPPRDQFAEPLDYLFAEHFRLRILCWMLDRIADAPDLDPQCADSALRFLREDFGPHILDEEEDLFPLLRRRAKPEDRVEDILGQLCQEHTADGLDASAIVKRLTAISGRRRLANTLRRLLRRFAANERHHLVVENAIVLPLARARLTAGDLRNLGRRMAARRGIDYPDQPHAA